VYRCPQEEGIVFEIIDLTRRLSIDSLSYPGDRTALELVEVDVGAPDARMTHLSHLDLHAGTHIDAPLHFVPGGSSVADLGIIIRPALVIRTRGQSIPAEALPDVPLAGCAVLLDSGWGRELSSKAYHDRFAFVSPKLAAAIVDRGVAIVGIDTPSVDSANAAPAYPAHRILLGAGVPIVEGLCNLEALSEIAEDWYFAVFPLSIDGVEGAPARAVALVPTRP
jgi:kynurenine formamidase